MITGGATLSIGSAVDVTCSVTSTEVPVSGTVTVGPREHLRVDALECIKPLWAGVPPQGVLDCTVQLRAHGEEHRAVVELVPPSTVEPVETVHVRLLDPAEGIAPGQACVIYDGTRVVGSATIDRTHRLVPHA